MTDNNIYLKQMSIDVEKARQSASFRIQDMNKLLLNNSYDANQKAKKIAESEPVFDKFPMHFKNRAEVNQESNFKRGEGTNVFACSNWPIH
ncbi:hypothetical protein RMATCC62417_12066 [Rhizopus microsporus]|nr:hypothetical protein RMATCC62417_12066 [Rhizopus microsporus]